MTNFYKMKVKAYTDIEKMINKAMFTKDEISLEIQRAYGLPEKFTNEYIKTLIELNKARLIEPEKVIVPAPKKRKPNSYYGYDIDNELEGADNNGNEREDRNENKRGNEEFDKVFDGKVSK